MRILAITLAAVAVAGCLETRGNQQIPGNPVGVEPQACIDNDHDGYGDGCLGGHDCNDSDPMIHDGCLHCAAPADGCPCKLGDRPVSCFVPATTAADGVLMCHEGTRYCRAAVWSGCEDLVSYPKPVSSTQNVIDPNLPPVHCSDCAIDCFQIHDNLDPVDGGLGDASNGSTIGNGGGLSLITTTQIMPDTYVFDPSTCMIGAAPDRDCDGIEDKYDPYPDQKPFATANPTLFLDVAPGETGTGSINVKFFLNSADVYFLVDQSGSMSEEHAALQAGLTTGTFITDPAYNCADYDFDFKPNNELKAQGLIGAVRCLMRDSNFGVGLFREIPFNAYAPEDQIVFRNYTDVWSPSYVDAMGNALPKANIDAAIAGVAKFVTIGNNDWPEADMLALNTLITGNGMYFGTTRPNIPPRTTCPAGTWGYPCFRNGAIPVVIMFTDAMMHNGPSANNYAYSSGSLGMTVGTSTTLTQEDNQNETFGSAEILGDLTSSYITLQGDTTAMKSDLGSAAVSCVSSTSASAPDALFKFIISGAVSKTVKVSTEGSEFDTTVSVFKGTLASPTTVTTGLATNDVVSNAYSLGDNYNKYQRVTGSTTTLAPDYSANDVTCGTSQQGKDSVFTFTLSAPTTIALDTANSSFGTVVGLFSGTPKTPSSYTTVNNTNDIYGSAYGPVSLYTNYLGFNGDTSNAAIHPDFTGSVVGCGAADASPDAVYSFTLSQAANVRLSAEDSTTFKPVVALTTAGTLLPTVTAIANTNDVQSSAYDIGNMAGKVLQLTGDNTALAADFAGVTTGCSAADGGKDAVFKFTLTGTKTLNIDTDGSSFDTVLSLYSGSVASDATLISAAGNGNETGATALNLGTVDGAKYVVTGGSTMSMAADYNGTQISCNSSTSATDAAFKFHVNATRTVSIDSSGTPWDTVLSLHHPALPDATVTALSTNNNESTASPYLISTAVDSTNQAFTGNTAMMSADVLVNDGVSCSASSSAPDAVFAFAINTAGTYEINTVGSSFNTVLGLFPSNPTFAAPTGPTAEGAQGEAKLSGSRPAATVTMGDGRTDGSNIDMASGGGWVVASANVNNSSINPSPQGTNLGFSSVTPTGGAAENGSTAQALGTVVQKDITVTDTFSGAVADHNSTAAWATCSDATAKLGLGADRVYSFTPTSSGTLRATMKSTNSSATSYTLGVWAGSLTPTSADWRDSSNISTPALSGYPWASTTLDTPTCGATTDFVINTAGSTNATIFPTWCGATYPAWEVQTQTSFGSTAPSVMVITFGGLTIASGKTLHLVGDKPSVLAVYGDASIGGTIDASAYSSYANGAGSTVACTGGGDGANGTSGSGAGGGSGGGFASAGASGAAGGVAGGPATSTEGNALLHPLRAGCSGGDGGSSGGTGGTGGGAVQLTVTGALSGTGTIKASGSGGRGATGGGKGGGGGGSGGAVLVEYGTNTSSLNLYANGGGGGGGSNGIFGGGSGATGSTSSSSGASGGSAAFLSSNGGGSGGYSAGNPGAGSAGGGSTGGGGGGGGGGYTKLRALASSTNWTPSNFTSGGVTFSGSNDVIFPSGCTVTITTNVATSNATITPTYSGCGSVTLPAVQYVHPSAAPSGEYAAVFPISGSFWLQSGATINLRGAAANSAPVIFAVQGSAQIDGTIDASSSTNATFGAGANPSACTSARTGGTGTAGTANDDVGDPGGGGGASKDNGLIGGSGTGGGAAAGAASTAWNTSTVPLQGGCAGGTARLTGGNGGGAAEVSAKGSLFVSSTAVMRAAGGGGKAGTSSGEDGGSGGGAGGAILLETRSYGTNNSTSLTANAGAGAGGCSTSSCSATDGANGTSATAAVGGTGVTTTTSVGSSVGGNGGNGGLSAVNAAGTAGTAGSSGSGSGTAPPSVNVTSTQWTYTGAPTWTCAPTQTTLNGAHTNAVTTITVSSTTGFPTAGDILVDSEVITYTGTTATTFTGATRGQRGTVAAAHSTGAVVAVASKVNASSTTLSPAINSTTTTITVASTAGFPPGGTIYIDSEAMSYTGTTATTFTGIVRHTQSTAAASHLINATVVPYGTSGGSLTAAATMVFGNTTGFSATGSIMIDNEIVSYTGTTATSFTGLTRATLSTVAATHANNANIVPVTIINSSSACASALSGETCNGNATLGAGAAFCSTGVAQDVAGSGPNVMVVRLAGLSMSGNRVLRLIGNQPIVFFVAGNVSVDGSSKIDAGSVAHAQLGAGGSNAANCSTSTGTGGDGGHTGSNFGAGGGGGFFAAGGVGGASAGGAGGSASVSTNLAPLRGGCSGGTGNDSNGMGTNGAGAYGGGAFEISASGMITIGTGSNTPVLSAAGGGGGGAASGDVGGGGGGSGGGILLVASSTPSIGSSAAVRAHGGGGAKGHVSGAATSNSGSDGSSTSDTAAAAGTTGTGGLGGAGGLCAGSGCSTTSSSGSGTSVSNIGGGGGGSGGRIRVMSQALTSMVGAGGGGGGGGGGIVVTSGFGGGNNNGSSSGTSYDFSAAASFCGTTNNSSAGTQLELSVTANQLYYLVAKKTASGNADPFTLDLQWADNDWPGVSEDRYAEDVYQPFSFTGSGTRTMTIDTQNTGFNAALAIYRDDGTLNTTSDDTAIGFAIDTGLGYATLNASITAGAKYYAIVKPLSGASLVSGIVNLSIRDTAATTGAIDIGSVDTAWTTYTGDTTNMADNGDFNGCNADITSHDAFYKFHVTTPNKSITIDMAGTATDLVIGVYKWDDTYVGCDRNTGSGDTLSYTHTYTEAGDYYLVIKGHLASSAGAYSLAFKDNSWVSNMLQCDDNSGGGTASLITRALNPGTYYAVVKGSLASSSGSYKLNVKDTTWTNAANRLSCNDDVGGGVTSSQIQQSLTPGDYWAVLKGHGALDTGSYSLTVQDLTTPPTSSRISCNDDHALVNTSRLTPTLGAGTYYLTVKAKAVSGTGLYKLNIADSSVAVASVLQCDSASGTNATALIERNLDPGTYNVVIKGKSSVDKGAYKLLMRDLTSQPSGLLSCDHTSGAAGKSYLEQDLPAGTYSVVVKGDASSSAGNYELTVRDANNIAVSTTAVACDDNTGYGNTSIISKSLAPGTYYAAVKGHTTSDKGRYQISIGAGATTAGTYVPPTWAQTLAALQAKNVHVMSVLSCQDDSQHGNAQGDCNSTRTQAVALANQTNALGYNLQPLVFDINSDGTGLSKTVVDGVASLAKYLQMDVGLRIVFDPDANPGFAIAVTPVPAAGDGCAGVSATDHLQCVPGATPRFNVSFTNPLAHPVPLNPHDPNGGYNFRAELIGNNKFIVDQVPIYIIPKNVTHLPMPPKVQAMGTYTQNVPAPGCTGNLLPDWRYLSWNATIPDGTKVDYKVCTADTTAGLVGCTYATVCTITGGAACLSNADCNAAAGAYCADSGNCQTISSGTCVNDTQCPGAARCIGGACTFSGQPVTIDTALPLGSNYRPYLAVQIDLYANVAANTGPTVHDWTLQYYCSNQQ